MSTLDMPVTEKMQYEAKIQLLEQKCVQLVNSCKEEARFNSRYRKRIRSLEVELSESISLDVHRQVIERIKKSVQK